MTIDVQFRAQRGAFSLDVGLKLPARGVTALFGHSGSGKTTMLRAMAGLEHCAGSMLFGDEIWQDHAQGVFLTAEKRPIGYVFQEASLFGHLSVQDNLEFGFRRTPVSKRRVDMLETVEWLGLGDLLQRSPVNLSGGERQRVAIARALLTSPELLLMDEPLSALDGAAKAAIMPYLERLHAELSIPVVYVTHAVEEVSRLADHIVQLEAGRVVAEGPALSILSDLHRPAMAGEEPGAVIEASIREHDDAHHLSELVLPCGQVVLAPRLAADAGSPVRIRIPAREVSISLRVPEGTSILNILPGRILDHEEGDPGRVLVQLELEVKKGKSTRLLSRISRYSWDRLGLREGMVVQAQIKSMGLAHEG